MTGLAVKGELNKGIRQLLVLWSPERVALTLVPSALVLKSVNLSLSSISLTFFELLLLSWKLERVSK